MTPRRTRILLADDHRVLTDALTATLEGEFEVAGTFENGRDLLDALDTESADVVVLDISMPGMNGLEAARRISAQHPAVRIVFLTMHPERPYVDQALDSGASAYVLKREAASDLARAIRSAMAGERYISPSAAQPSPEAAPKHAEDLTARQREVLQLVAEGRSAKVIASELKISPKTVEFHKAAIMERLGLHTTADLVRYALSHGMVS